MRLNFCPRKQETKVLIPFEVMEKAMQTAVNKGYLGI